MRASIDPDSLGLRLLVAAVLAGESDVSWRVLDEDELIGNWTLVGDELPTLIAGKEATFGEHDQAHLVLTIASKGTSVKTHELR